MMSDYSYYVQQVKECCRCFECASDEQWEQAIISALETWGNLTCGNWLDDHSLCRTIPLSKECEGCCPKIYTTNLPETWIKEDSINVVLRAWHGLDVEEIQVKSLYDPCTHDLMIDLTNVMNCCDNCVKYDLYIDYEVGTDELPAEFCRWFCAIAKVYMQSEEIECASCGDMDSVAIVEVDGTKDLSATYKLLAMKYFDLLISRYSLCILKSLHDYSARR